MYTLRQNFFRLLFMDWASQKEPKGNVVGSVIWFTWFTCTVWRLCWYHLYIFHNIRNCFWLRSNNFGGSGAAIILAAFAPVKVPPMSPFCPSPDDGRGVPALLQSSVLGANCFFHPLKIKTSRLQVWLNGHSWGLWRLDLCGRWFWRLW